MQTLQIETFLAYLSDPCPLEIARGTGLDIWHTISCCYLKQTDLKHATVTGNPHLMLLDIAPFHYSDQLY